jgi:glutaminase
MDRIENGEFIYDQKTGQVIRTPAKLRDLNTAFNTLLDKRQLLRNKPTKIVEQQQTATQLQNLAEQFAKFVKNTAPKEVEYIEGETVVQNEEGVWEVKDE